MMHISPKKIRLIIITVFLLALAIILYFIISKSPRPPVEKISGSCLFLKQNPAHADSLIAKMTVEEKAGQLLMLEMTATQNTVQAVEELNKFKPGGFFLSGGAISKISSTTNLLQEMSDIPLFFSVNAPCGFYSPDDSLKSCSVMPDINYFNDEQLIKNLSLLVEKQMKYCGIQINLMLPLYAINSNFDVPWNKSYAQFAFNLQKKLLLFQKQMEKAKLFVCAYGLNTDESSQFNYPMFRRFDTLRRMSLISLVNNGLSGIMINNGISKLPDSLKNTYKYQGLIFSILSEKDEDAKQSRLSARDDTDGNDAVGQGIEMLNSGSDILIIPANRKNLIENIIEGIKHGKISEDSLNKKVKRILLAKTWMNIKRSQKTNTDSANYYCRNWQSKMLYQRIISSSVVLLNNRKNIIPVKNFEKEKFAVLQIGKTSNSAFINSSENYVSAARFLLQYDAADAAINALPAKMKSYSCIIITVFENPVFFDNKKAEKFQQLIEKLSVNKKVIVAIFGSTRFLSLFHRFPCMLWSLSQTTVAQQTVSSIIFGGEKVIATLPYSFSQEFCYNDGLEIKNAIRFKYTSPEDAGIDGDKLYKIDSIAEFAINSGAFPGCQVFFARNGKVFYNKSFGTHIYDKKEKVKNTDLYDMASVTKVAATTLALMALYDKGKIKLDTTLNYYFDDLNKNARGKKVRISKLNYITLRELLTHRSGLPEGLPIGLFISPRYAIEMMKKQLKKLSDTTQINDTLDENDEKAFYADIDTSLFNAEQDSLLKFIFSNTKKPEYTLEIAKNFYLRTVLTDSLWQLAKQTSMRKSKKYLYSDMNLFMVMKVVEKVAKMQLDKYLDQAYLALLNLKRIGFNPLKNFKKEEIIPTEDEKYFRKQLIHGYVHDPMAALLGGIGGNAGLFSNAHDLGVLMQMLLNKGTYGGIRFLSEKTVELFTSAQDGTYRGLGFDRKGKPDAKMIARGASMKTYGHTGFTGTCVWVDPEYKLVYVFLSNRVHPKVSNQKINNYRIRQNIQQVVYEAIISPN